MIYVFLPQDYYFRIIYKFFFALETVGLEHIPSEGGVFLCSNHISLIGSANRSVSYLKRKCILWPRAELFDISALVWLIIDNWVLFLLNGEASVRSRLNVA